MGSPERDECEEESSKRVPNPERKVQCCYPDPDNNGARCPTRQYGFVCQTHHHVPKMLPNYHVLTGLNSKAAKRKHVLTADDAFTRKMRLEALNANKVLRRTLCLHLLPDNEIPAECHFICPGPGASAAERCSDLVDPVQGFCPRHIVYARNERRGSVRMITESVLTAYRSLLEAALIDGDNASLSSQASALGDQIHETVHWREDTAQDALSGARANFLLQQRRQMEFAIATKKQATMLVGQAQKILPELEEKAAYLRSHPPLTFLSGESGFGKRSRPALKGPESPSPDSKRQKHDDID